MGKKVEGVGVMKEKELKIEEVEAFHTLGGVSLAENSGNAWR